MDYDYNRKEQQIDELQQKLFSLRTQIVEKAKQLYKIQCNIDSAQGQILAEDLGISYSISHENQIDAEIAIDEIKYKLASLIKNDSYFVLNRKYIIDGSEKKGRDFVKAFCENNILGFNLYCEKKRKSITKTNYGTTIDLIDKAFNRYSKRLNIISGEFNTEYLHWMKKLVKAELDLKLLKAEEREKIKEEKRKLREEQQFLAEAEKERKKLEEERKNLQKLFAKAISYQEQEEIKAKLAEVDKRVEEVDWRVSHYSAGWLYITTTPSMPGIYKCGCTKQLNPLNRIAQISSASVPFPFECRGLVFSENVFDLEAKMHRRLDSNRVNKENKLKEFFYGNPEEAIKILTNEFHEEVRFINEQWVNNEDGNETD